MRIVEAKGQYFAYRVMIGRVVADLTNFGIALPRAPGDVDREIVKAWAEKLRTRFGGDAYTAREAKSLQQSWCYDKAKVLGEDEPYFAFVRDEDAIWFHLLAGESNG